MAAMGCENGNAQSHSEPTTHPAYVANVVHVNQLCLNENRAKVLQVMRKEFFKFVVILNIDCLNKSKVDWKNSWQVANV